MIGVISGVARTAMANALRQVAREFGREAMERIMGGEAIMKRKPQTGTLE